MEPIKKLLDYIKSQDVFYAGEIEIKDIVIDDKVRSYCMENKCGNYDKNFMCPPSIGKVEDCIEKLNEYESSIVLTKTQKILSKKDKEEYYKPAEKLHKILLNVEQEARKLGYEKAFALIGGNCRLCSPCKKILGEEVCPYPEKARPSLEALGIDVIETLKNMGVYIEFRDDEVTWVGMMLI